MISYHFGPAGPVGGLRWWGLGRNLSPAGWKIHVVSATDLGEQLPEGKELPDGFTHHSLEPRPTVGEYYRRLRRPSDGNGAKRPDAPDGRPSAAAPAVTLAPDPAPGGRPSSGSWLGTPSALVRRGVKAARGEASALLSFPDEARGWVTRATLEARRIIRDVSPDVVISSGPPHSAHLVAWLALQGHDVRWLIDLRDPWWEDTPRSANRTAELRGSRWLRGAVERMEAGTLASASGFITTTEELRDQLVERYPGTTGYCLTNGFDEEWLPKRSGEPYPGLSIAHVGTLYARRDPRPLIRAFRRFLDRFPEARTDGSCIRFAGVIEPIYRAMLDSVIEQLDMEDHVEIMGLLPREEAIQVLARSKAAVILNPDQQVQIPAKIYEAVAMGVPTLVVATEESSSAAAANALGISFAERHDVEAMADFFARVARGEVGPGTSASAAGIDYRTLALDAENILLHDPGSGDPLPPAPLWLSD